LVVFLKEKILKPHHSYLKLLNYAILVFTIIM